jgi:hypothetical protein
VTPWLETLLNWIAPWRRAPGDMLHALSTTESLLRRYDHDLAANLAEIALRSFTDDPAGTCAQLNSPEWWGPGPSVAEIELPVDGGFSADARRDGRRLRHALIEIYRCMKAYGEVNEAAEIQVAQFDKWLKSDI